MIRVVRPGVRIFIFYLSRIPDPESRGQNGTGSGSATLVGCWVFAEKPSRIHSDWRIIYVLILSVICSMPCVLIFAFMYNYLMMPRFATKILYKLKLADYWSSWHYNKHSSLSDVLNCKARRGITL
jgi:hypothetical protein